MGEPGQRDEGKPVDPFFSFNLRQSSKRSKLSVYIISNVSLHLSDSQGTSDNLMVPKPPSAVSWTADTKSL